jgi:hypothetical protein
MFTIGDIVQIDYDLINTPLKMGMLATVVHQHNDTAYEIEPFLNTLIEETFAVQSEQVTLVWSVEQEALLPTKQRAMQAAWHIRKYCNQNQSDSLRLAWKNVKNANLDKALLAV